MTILQKIADIHQLPESHPISQSPKISLAHIPTAKLFSRQMARLANATAREALGESGARFAVGQIVRTNLGKVGPIVEIVENHVSVEINGDVKKFHATTIVKV